MRWDNLLLEDRSAQSGPSRLTAPLFEQGAVARTFDTPEFRGITFYEIRAKSITIMPGRDTRLRRYPRGSFRLH